MFIFAKHSYKKSTIKIFLPVWKGGILTIWFVLEIKILLCRLEITCW